MTLLLGLISFCILILSIILHEVAHGYAADALGDPTARLAGRLTLNPLPHIDLMGSVILPALFVVTHSPILFGWAKPVPYNPYNLKNKRWGEFLVAVAGSLTNLSLALVFGLLIRFNPLGFDALMLNLAALICLTNLFLGLFNLLPFPPLDGFTALRAALPWQMRMSFERFEQRVRGMGVFSLLLFLFVFSYLFADGFSAGVWWTFQLLTGTHG